MQLAQQIQQHVEQLPNELQAEVLNYILKLEQQHKKTSQKMTRWLFMNNS